MKLQHSPKKQPHLRGKQANIAIIQFLWIVGLAVIGFVSAGLSANSPSAKERLLVFAAASFKDVVEDFAESYEAECDCSVVVSIAGSGVPARQIAAGAPADVYVSASPLWMKWLVARGFISEGDVSILAHNSLVIAAGKSVKPFEDIRVLSSFKRFAMGEPESVPAGIYAQQALERLGVWDEMRSRAVFSENVRIGAAMVERGDVPAAILYASDLTIIDDLRIVYRFDQNTHDVISYPAALLSGGQNIKLAKMFLNGLQSDLGQAIVRQYGFEPARKVDAGG